MDLRKHFRTLMEEVDLNYQPQPEITKFAPVPASQVLKELTVDAEFIRQALLWAGGEPNAVEQLVTQAVERGKSGPLTAGSFQDLVGAAQGMGQGAPVGPNGALTPPVDAQVDVAVVAPAAPMDVPPVDVPPMDGTIQPPVTEPAPGTTPAVDGLPATDVGIAPEEPTMPSAPDNVTSELPPENPEIDPAQETPETTETPDMDVSDDEEEKETPNTL
jgi:hypothetical protein